MNVKMQRWNTLACAVVLAATLGCGGTRRGAVSGQVTLDGQPVESGTISFIPAGAKHAPAAWSEIKGGRYSIPASQGPAVGPNRVEIRWPRKTGKKLPAVPPAPETDEVVEAIPPHYNTQSDLKAEIKPGANPLDFDLKRR